MSRWEVAPNGRQRWVARHRTRLKLGLLLWIALAVAFGSYVILTDRSRATSATAVLALAGPVSAYVVVNVTGRFVESWDREHP